MKGRFLSLICVYAPTMSYTQEAKDDFYFLLNTTISNIPPADKLLVLGDFNASVGSDYHHYKPCLGHFGKGKSNSNGECLLNLCEELQEALNKSLAVSVLGSDVEKAWSSFKKPILDTYNAVLGQQKRKTADWFDENNQEIKQLLQEKQKLSDAKFKSVKAKVQRRIREMKDKWWSTKADELQACAERHDSQGTYNILTTIYGPKTNALMPVKNGNGSCLLTDVKDITTRWEEYFTNYSTKKGMHIQMLQIT
ncbi:hypothetical protein BSL78_18932 [Apostichopus japonicus]|uniref:Endonuclease/exonuclease/phosphatase domain-containing protein n=1 Tax=Stichopus japonicus TaxID=307972 RepID=A0A2G8K888_STIJA|nr:hypothetical protein BSL78_18932 [Apostichopus japonicus]